MKVLDCVSIFVGANIFFVCLHQQKLKNPYISATKSCMKTINSSMNSSGELDSIEYF